MKNYLPILILFASVHSYAVIQPEITAFLSSFPDKMTCKGVELNFQTDTRKQMQQKIAIVISNKTSDNPMIEVNAPSASARSEFKIGNGYGGRATASGKFSYALNAETQVMYYVRVANEGDPVDAETLLRVRDAGGLVSFSNSRVCSTTYNCIEISDCLPVQ